MKKVLLDTNAYTTLLRGDEAVLEALGRAETVFISVDVFLLRFMLKMESKW